MNVVLISLVIVTSPLARDGCASLLVVAVLSCCGFGFVAGVAGGGVEPLSASAIVVKGRIEVSSWARDVVHADLGHIRRDVSLDGVRGLPCSSSANGKTVDVWVFVAAVTVGVGVSRRRRVTGSRRCNVAKVIGRVSEMRHYLGSGGVRVPVISASRVSAVVAMVKAAAYVFDATNIVVRELDMVLFAPALKIDAIERAEENLCILAVCVELRTPERSPREGGHFG